MANNNDTEQVNVEFDVPEHYLEQLRHECTGRPDTRIDENERRKRQAVEEYYKNAANVAAEKKPENASSGDSQQ